MGELDRLTYRRHARSTAWVCSPERFSSGLDLLEVYDPVPTAISAKADFIGAASKPACLAIPTKCSNCSGVQPYSDGTSSISCNTNIIQPCSATAVVNKLSQSVAWKVLPKTHTALRSDRSTC